MQWAKTHVKFREWVFIYIYTLSECSYTHVYTGAFVSVSVCVRVKNLNSNHCVCVCIICCSCKDSPVISNIYGGHQLPALIVVHSIGEILNSFNLVALLYGTPGGTNTQCQKSALDKLNWVTGSYIVGHRSLRRDLWPTTTNRLAHTFARHWDPNTVLGFCGCCALA